jgi:RNA polymerase sigma-70 factor (ECF subfamily)
MILSTLAALAPAVAPDDDAALIARHLRSDPAAFVQIYRAYFDTVYRRLTRILGPIPEREDLAQDVFLGLHRTLPRFRGEAGLGTLIHRIALNVAFDYLRRSARRPAVPVDGSRFDELVTPAGSPEQRAAIREELACTFACLARIKPKKRIALLLRVVDGLSFEQIGKLVDASPEAVAKRVQHGQRELEELWVRARGGVS